MAPNVASKVALGLDIGTSSAKVCAVDLNGMILGMEAEPYPTSLPQPGWVEQNADDWMVALGRSCRRLLTRLGLRPGDVLGLSITSAAHIGVLLDQNGKVLRPSLLWNDQRSKLESAELATQHGQFVFERGNNWPTTTWTLPHLAWIRRHDRESWQKMRYLLLSKDYITYRLTGRMITDPAAAVSALLYDVHLNGWSRDICDLIELPMKVLPEVAPIGAEIGTVTLEAAEVLGVKPATPVFNGTMDSIAETFSAVVRTEQQCIIRLASAGGIHAISRTFTPHPKLISYPYLQEGYWLSQAGTATCAAAIHWAKDVFFSSGGVDFDAWSKLAEKSLPGANGVMFHPYLAGERCPYWDPDLRGSFIGIGLHNKTSDMARAVYEGTAYSLLDAFSILEEQGFAPSEIGLVGGGAKSLLWCQTIADVFGFPVTPMPQADSSYGGALICLSGFGVDICEKRAPPSVTNPTIDPDNNLRAFHDGKFDQYCFAQRQLSEIYHRQL